MCPSKPFRDLLQRPGIIRSIGVHDTFSALLAAQAGLETVFVGGFGISASTLGLPDVGLLTLTEMAEAVRRISQRLDIPVMADGDTGHGDLHNVARTVREFERAGAAGVLLEDQVAPKRCGHFKGKQVVPADEMILKLKAALDARNNEDFVIVARTDARAVEGIDAAIERANRYGQAGAQVVFIEAPESRDELERIPREVEYPLLANMLTGGVTPILSVRELETLGYKIAVCPIAGLLACGTALRRVIGEFMDRGRVDHLQPEMMTFDEIKETLGLQNVMDLRRRLESL